MWENVFLLLVTAGIKVAFTALTFGMMVSKCNATQSIHVDMAIQVPAGIFLPTIAIGASLGRAVGLLT